MSVGDQGGERYVWRTDKDGAVRRHVEPLARGSVHGASVHQPTDHFGESSLRFRCIAEPFGGPELPARCGHGTSPVLRRNMGLMARSFLRLGDLDSFEQLAREVQRLQPQSHRRPTR